MAVAPASASAFAGGAMTLLPSTSSSSSDQLVIPTPSHIMIIFSNMEIKHMMIISIRLHDENSID